MHELRDLEIRLAKVEKQNRLMRRLGLLAIAITAVAGWKSGQAEVVEAKTVRADMLQINCGDGSLFTVAAVLEGNDKKGYPVITLKGKEKSMTIDPRQIFIAGSEENDSINTLVEAGRLSAYHNLGGSPSATLMVEKGRGGLDVRTSSEKMRTEDKEASMFFGAIKNEAGVFFEQPKKPAKKVQTIPFLPPAP